MNRSGCSGKASAGKRGGFTLVELILVIAIIAVLAMASNSALREAREAARRAHCANNLKRIGAALAMYQLDYDGKIPVSANVMGRTCKDGAWGPADTQASWNVLVFDYLTDGDAFYCPSDLSNMNPSFFFLEHSNLNDSRSCNWEIPDSLSYAYTGQTIAEQNDAAKNPQTFRIAGDNDREGDEYLPEEYRPGRRRPDSPVEDSKPEVGTYNDSVGFSMSVSGECPAFLPTWPKPGYRYVGGLEEDDNHGKDGVNVLYYDWHVEFDDRAFPSPLGWHYTAGGTDTDDGEEPEGVWDEDDVWQKAYWRQANMDDLTPLGMGVFERGGPHPSGNGRVDHRQ